MGKEYNVKETPFRSYINVKEEVAQCHSRNIVRRAGNSQARIQRAQRIADDLTRRFGPASKNCYAYFCKCAYRLSENTIWNCYEDAHKSSVKNNLAYFLSVTRSQPEMR